ncbi:MULTISPECIES: 50S ribosomal protein L18 [Alysiella]|uniref:Large ribosomal subunit protein uL18 n=1 Tax=Alysiella filiformis DSM 16848 TaxID=1120981 RepID=A0A286EES4_9NEIS|nr:MULTISPECIES: 50S ribosomal protein L18 [Alysiella]MDO4433100.1 50S ribosomal protein L18 [Alysiella sp.]QMT31858.1 50S ribosomal protein L18 [Alysiella filiformis]UBQ57237.1 50S ribosomal protein L18 [Alysiella filiformis DSM 16848]SOD69416.1 large subunit ribosomal protein L18 [Alysiella filiformis DSM 16848]
MNKKIARLRRARKTRARIADLKMVRLCVFRTNSHIYAQIISAEGDKVLASASTVEAEVRGSLKNGGNTEAAAVVGKRIAEKAKAAGIEKVAFDRSGFQYHGRVKALAEAARENGLSF